MNDLAVRRRGSALAYGSRTEVPVGCGSVNAQAMFAGFDRASGRATYAVRIANNSEQPLLALVRFPGARTPFAGELHVAPFSILDTLVPSGSTRRDDRAIVEVRSADVRFTVDAHAVARPKRRIVGMYAGAAVCASVLLGLAAGMLPHKAAARAPQPVVQTRVVVRHVADKPLLDDLEVTPSSVVAGSALQVRYAARANGDVWLLDDHGQVWARRDIAASGETRFTIPERAAGRNLRVVVSAHRGAERAQMAAAVAVLPDGANAAAADPASTAPPAPSVSPDRVKAGNPVYVHFPAAHGEALVSITDAGGSILEEVDVAAGQREAALRAPTTAAPGTYDVVISTVNGNTQEQSVHAITVVP